jgi:hypothetical protein
MIEYFTALVISYHLQGEPIDATIWLDSEARCETAMRGASDLYETIYRLYGKDIMMRCHTSELVSKPLVRPQARPEGLTNG